MQSTRNGDVVDASAVKKEDSAALALADFIEVSRAQIAAMLGGLVNLFGPDEKASILDQWLQDQISYFRGGPAHTCEWIALVVNRVRDRGGRIDELLGLLRTVRSGMLEFVRLKMPDAAESEVYRLVFGLEDEVLRHIGDLYGEAERKASGAERRRMQLMADSMDHGFVLLGGDGVVQLSNSFLGNLLGMASERLSGHNFLSCCDSETATELRRDLRQKRGTGSRTFDGSLAGPLGARIPVRLNVLPIFDEQGLRSGIALSVMSLEHAAQSADPMSTGKLLKDVANTLGMGYYLIDEGARVIDANDGAISFVQISQEDNSAYCCRREVDRVRSCIDCLRAGVLASGHPYRAAVQVSNRAGDLRWVEMACAPVRNAQGQVTYVAKFLRDITEHRLLEDQMLRQQDTSLMSQLAVSVAHQLRNPLGVAIGFAELLSRGMPPEQVPVAVDKILRSGMRCKEIVESLLEFGKGISVQYAPTDLNALIQERVQSLYSDPRIEWRLGAGVRPVDCASEQISLVLFHLLDSTLGSARSRVIFETFEDGDAVVIRVSHDGPSLPEDQRERVFDPFFSMRGEQGTVSLGLCLSRTVVREHRGELALKEGEHGPCFVMRLPTEAGVRPLDTIEEKKPDAPLRAQRRILIVEDDPDQLFLLSLALETEGHRVDMAATGPEAVQLIDANAYDAAVLDVLLGEELRGQELYQIIRAKRPELAERVLFVTGDTMKYETRRFLQEVKRPYLEKPFMMTDFSSKLQGILSAASPVGQGV